ncbi:hypothetical protein [Sphingomonas alpina]|uniref:Uncharacterized protein n=1 Tax=Sphingomonas alpina TaxID=653931 RepID=A0A7H0LF60_9SPHN|nr:hypothetical protein [Sphingomonas alpina]QNQ08313.1 hypothetical protein H3Z74_16355 [Sphingomonas alpina]
MAAALLCAGWGLALSSASRQARTMGVGVIIAGAAGGLLLPLPGEWLDTAFFGCWVSLVATAAAVHLPGGCGLRMATTLSLNAGLWSGAVIALGGSPRDLLSAFAAAMIMLPATWLARRGAGIAAKVASSWLIAIALLAAALQLLPVTPGYLPDHLE